MPTATLRPEDSLDISTLGRRLRDGQLRLGALVEGVLARIAAHAASEVWIHLLSHEALLQRAAELERRGPAGLPLYGLPFAIRSEELV